MVEELFAGRSLQVRLLRCPPAAPTWGSTLRAGAAAAVFPLTSLVVDRGNERPTLANPNHVLFVNRGERVRRTLHDPRGEVSVVVTPEPSLVARLTGGEALPAVAGPCATGAYLAQHDVVRRLRAGAPVDRGYVEETFTAVLERTIRDARALQRMRRSRRAITQAQHHELVEAAKALLTEHPAERWTLAAVARELHLSEFHLARIFRVATGFSLQRYRNELRLRLALDLLDDAAVTVGELAHRLGYASHSHFTDSFIAAFGAPPSVVRGLLGPRSSREVDATAEVPFAHRW